MNSFQNRIWIFLTFRGRHIIEALTVSFCAGDEFLLSHIRKQHVVLKVEKYISELPFVFFLSFKVVLYIMEYAFFPLAWKFRPFSKLPLEDQLKYLETWEQSAFALKRNLFKLVKAACVCHIFTEHRLLEALGYGEAMRDRMGSRKRGSLPGTDFPT